MEASRGKLPVERGGGETMTEPIKIKVDMTDLDKAIEKATQLGKALQEANSYADELASRMSNMKLEVEIED